MLYKYVIEWLHLTPLALMSERKDIATMISGFVYTMLGFLATIITILFAFTHRENFVAYKRKGYLSVFFYSYFLTIINMIVTAFLALSAYSKNTVPFTFNALTASFANNIWQIAFLTLIIVNIARKS